MGVHHGGPSEGRGCTYEHPIFLQQKRLGIHLYCHQRSQGPATLGSWPGSHGTAEAGGEWEVRTQGRRPVRGGRRRGREATGERREAGGGAAAEPGTGPPSLDAAEGEAADARKIRCLGPSLSASGEGALRDRASEPEQRCAWENGASALGCKEPAGVGLMGH